MPVTIIFENAEPREFPAATSVQSRGQGVVVFAADGQQIAALDGPVESVVVNGQEIDWPPN